MIQKGLSSLPKEYQMTSLPFSVELVIKGFKEKHVPDTTYTLAPRKRDCEEWYHEFIDKIIDASGKKFLPIIRIGDGEFLLMLGKQPVNLRYSFLQKIKLKIIRLKWNFLLNGGIAPKTVGHYHSGQYTRQECLDASLEIPQIVKEVLKKGILAPMTMYSTEPFAEHYFPAFDKWLQKNQIMFNDNNYYPQYFIYSALNSDRRSEILEGRRILIINGAEGEKKEQIINGLKKEGVAEVHWCPISLKRSMFDVIDVKPYIGKVDLAFVGAGVGKFKIFAQLEKLNIPCIDAGFVFEIWADSNNKFERPFCASDNDWKKRNKL